MKKLPLYGIVITLGALAALTVAGCAAKEEPLTEKLPPKVERANGPSAAGMSAPAGGAPAAAPAPAAPVAQPGT